jgi:NAD(P) transhydrogenase subunit alpha
MALPVVGIPKETFAGERRVAATPDTVAKLLKLGFAKVVVEKNAGAGAGTTDAQFTAAGATVVDDVWSAADVVAKVRAPTSAEVKKARRGQHVISFVYPAQNAALLDELKAAGVTQIAMEQIPRITRAQKMDALSSMANIAGYRAVIEAANLFPRLFSGQITAAGKMPPAKVLIIGAGVAGLASIGAARGLGAVVRAFDTRAAVREQVQSMGAEFLEVTIQESGEGGGGYAKEMSPAFIEAEMALFRAQAKEVDIVITTALIPGKPAPKLILKDMVDSMRAGSVVVDLAAEQGGNCEYTKPGELFVTPNGVSIVGYTDLPSRMAAQASQLYGQNIVHLLDDMTLVKGGERNFRVDFDDEVVRAATVVKDGEITWPPPKKAAPPPADPAKPTGPATYPVEGKPTSTSGKNGHAASETKAIVPAAAHKPSKSGSAHAPVGLPGNAALLVVGAVLIGVGVAAPPAFLGHLIVFVLACFIGYQVIWNVTPALHTPLMSVTNAISGIILVGGLLHASDGVAKLPASTILGAVAILVATINIAGGFLVTQRMLKMFRRGDA